MPNDVITFAVNGELTLERFAVAIRRFTDLVNSLSHELARGDVSWVLDDLEYGSAIATARAVPKDTEAWPKVEEIIKSYLTVGEALEAREPIPFPPVIERRASKVRELLDGDIESIRFETNEADVVIERTPEPQPIPAASRVNAYAFGAVRGRVQALSNRGSLRFTLYEALHDRAVSCYMSEGQEDLMKDLWGRLVAVEGRVRRHTRTGQPQTVRDIRTITPVQEGAAGDYMEARGAVKRLSSVLRSEEVIRRMRDAG